MLHLKSKPNVARFVSRNESGREHVEDGQTAAQLSAAERERRRQDANAARIHPRDLRLTGAPDTPKKPQLGSTTRSVSNQEFSSKMPPKLDVHPGVFDDTDVEAGDETMSSFTDPPSAQQQHFPRPQMFAQESEYGGDDDDYNQRHGNPGGSSLSQDWELKQEVETYGGYEGGDTQPTQGSFMGPEIANIEQQHARLTAGKGRSNMSERGRQDKFPHGQHAQTPRHRNQSEKTHLTVEIPLRSGSAPPNSHSDEISPLETKFLPGISAEKTISSAFVIPNSQPFNAAPFTKPTITHREPFRPAATPSTGVDNATNRTSHVAKASESTLDQTSGYTSESSEIQNNPPSKKRGWDEKELDYDLQTLAAMPFGTLQSQSFDTDPRASSKTFQFPFHSDGSLPPSNIAEKMSHLLSSLPQRDSPNETDTDQASLTAMTKIFSAMPLSEWEEAGDWLLDRLSQILSQTKTARQERRNVASSFEAEVQKRYEDVERKRVGIERTLEGMRGGAQGVLMRGRTPTKQ